MSTANQNPAVPAVLVALAVGALVIFTLVAYVVVAGWEPRPRRVRVPRASLDELADPACNPRLDDPAEVTS